MESSADWSVPNPYLLKQHRQPFLAACAVALAKTVSGELIKELPNFPPDTDLPRIPDELGTPEEFLEQVREGYLDVYLRPPDRSKQEI